MGTKLPWYVLPVYPALALAGGAQLAEIGNWPSRRSYPRVWKIGLILLSVGAIALSAYFGLLTTADHSLSVIFASVAVTMAIAAFLIARRDLQFILILFWGTYISLLLFMTSPYWIGELKEAYPIKPVAAILNHRTPEGQQIYASFSSNRPALNFYSDRQVIPASDSELQQRWKQDQKPYLLLDTKTHDKLSLESSRQLDTAADWVLITKATD
jgi:4-amino-4-deoxy-L-arabinose transferase-like glycosyltransferase